MKNIPASHKEVHDLKFGESITSQFPNRKNRRSHLNVPRLKNNRKSKSKRKTGETVNGRKVIIQHIPNGFSKQKETRGEVVPARIIYHDQDFMNKRTKEGLEKAKKKGNNNE